MNKNTFLFVILLFTCYSPVIANKSIKPMGFGEICIDNLNYEFYDLVPVAYSVDNIPTSGALATGTITNFNVATLQNNVDLGDDERYSIRYTATLNVNIANTYYFYTSSDDGSKLFIDGIEIVDNDGLHASQERSGSIALTTGTHSLEVTFFENTGGNSLNVSYGIATSDRFTLTSCSEINALNSDSDGDTIFDRIDLDDDNDGILDTDEEGCYGVLNYEFYDLIIPGNTVENIPTTGALSTGTVSSFETDTLQNIVDSGDKDYYGIRFTGNITLTESGNYTFYTTSDDGSKLFIDGFQVVDNDGLHRSRERRGDINLTKGLHSITVLFFEGNGNSNLKVRYQSATIPKTEIPFTVLSCGLDSDADGAPNYLDTNSDNDKCPDALEADGSFSAINLANYPTDVSLGNSSNAEGIPIVNGTTAQQSNTNDVIDNTLETCVANLNLIKTVNNAIIKKGNNIIYTISLTNNGSNNATNIIVEDILPSSLTFVSASSPSGTIFNNTNNTWNLNGFTLLPNTSINIEITATVNAIGTILNTTEIIASDQIDNNSIPNSGN